MKQLREKALQLLDSQEDPRRKNCFFRSHNSGLATIIIRVNVGSVDESPEIAGISHIVEHSHFLGTPTRSKKQIRDDASDLQSLYNAWTDFAETCYIITAPATRILEAYQLLSDIFFNPTFPIEELKLELNVILNEFHRVMDDPSGYLYYKIGGRLIGKSPIGEIETIRGMTREKLIEFSQRYYGVNNSSIFVTGNLQESVVSKIFEDFCAHRRGESNERSAVEPLLLESAEDSYSHTKDVESILHMLVFEGERARDRNYLLHDVAVDTLGEFLTERIREELGLVYGIRCYHISYQTCNKVFVDSSVSPKDYRTFKEALKSAIDEVSNRGLTLRLLKKSVNQAEFQRLHVMESSASKCRSLSYMVGLGLPENWFDNYSEMVKKVTIEELDEAAKKLVKSKNVLCTLSRGPLIH